MSRAPVDLSTVTPPLQAGVQPMTMVPAEWLTLARRARWLSWASLAYMGVEGVVALAAGLVAGSVALIGFGIGSAIEGVASLVIVWRFTGSRLLSDHAERRAQRLVAIQFFVLAPYVTFQASADLLTGARPDVSWVGMGLAVSSLVLMPLLGVAKRRIGQRIGSLATQGEGAQNLLCAYMAAALFAGLAANALLGLWWLDPVAALAIAALAVREGMGAWRGDSCCICTDGDTARSDDDNGALAASTRSDDDNGALAASTASGRAVPSAWKAR